MGRKENPIATRAKALRELAEWLRDQRSRAGLSYRQLAERAATCHATTLQRAASGKGVPPLLTVLAYARACDASPQEARRLWKAARYEETRAARVGCSQPAPRPELIRNFVDLSAALVELREKAGSPSLRTMEHRAGGYGVLPHSTAGRIANKQAVPHSRQQFEGYLRACEVPDAQWPAWQAAWTRAWRNEKQDDVAALESIAAGAVVRGLVHDAWDSVRTKMVRVYDSSDVGADFVVRDRSGSPHAVQVKHFSHERQMRPPHRVIRLSERPVPGQMAFSIRDDPQAGGDGLF